MKNVQLASIKSHRQARHCTCFYCIGLAAEAWYVLWNCVFYSFTHDFRLCVSVPTYFFCQFGFKLRVFCFVAFVCTSSTSGCALFWLHCLFLLWLWAKFNANLQCEYSVIKFMKIFRFYFVICVFKGASAFHRWAGKVNAVQICHELLRLLYVWGKSWHFVNSSDLMVYWGFGGKAEQ